MRRRQVRSAAALALATSVASVVAAVPLAQPAYAAPSGSVTITAPDYELPNDGTSPTCATYSYQAAIATSTDTTGDDVRLTVTAPDGTEVGTFTVSGPWPASNAGGNYVADYRPDVDFCDGNGSPTPQAGSYTVSGTARFYSGASCGDPAGTCVDGPVVADTFVLTKQLPPWDMTGRVTRLKSKPLVVKVRVSADQQPAGTRLNDPLRWRLLMRGPGSKTIFKPVWTLTQRTPGRRALFRKTLPAGTGTYRFWFYDMSDPATALRFKVRTSR